MLIYSILEKLHDKNLNTDIGTHVLHPNFNLNLADDKVYSKIKSLPFMYHKINIYIIIDNINIYLVNYIVKNFDNR